MNGKKLIPVDLEKKIIEAAFQAQSELEARQAIVGSQLTLDKIREVLQQEELRLSPEVIEATLTKFFPTEQINPLQKECQKFVDTLDTKAAELERSLCSIYEVFNSIGSDYQFTVSSNKEYLISRPVPMADDLSRGGDGRNISFKRNLLFEVDWDARGLNHYKLNLYREFPYLTISHKTKNYGWSTMDREGRLNDKVPIKLFDVEITKKREFERLPRKWYQIRKYKETIVPEITFKGVPAVLNAEYRQYEHLVDREKWINELLEGSPKHQTKFTPKAFLAYLTENIRSGTCQAILEELSLLPRIITNYFQEKNSKLHQLNFEPIPLSEKA